MASSSAVRSMSDDTSPHTHALGPPSTHAFRPPRACEGCRSLKVQCAFDSSQPSTCRRCIKARRRCVITERRKRRVVESSVTDLERKLNDLSADLEAIKTSSNQVAGQQQDSSSGRNYDAPGPTLASGGNVPIGPKFDFGKAPAEMRRPGPTQSSSQQNDSSSAYRGSNLYETSTVSIDADDVIDSENLSTYEQQMNSLPGAISLPAPRASQGVNFNARQQWVESGDVIDQGLLTTQAAFAAFDHFVSNTIVHFPVVAFPPGITAARMRQMKPVLFLAILGAACGAFPVTVQRQIIQELMAVFADRIIRIGEKSLELIQAVSIAMIWYYPPGRYEELKYYQLIHCAGVMAIEMGLSRKGKPRKPVGLAEPKNGKPAVDPGTIEARRAWLGCYFMGAHTAQNLRRVNLIRWSPYLEECLEMLETSPAAAPSDQVLCHWVRLQHISDDVSMQLSVEDPATCNGLDDPRVRFSMQGFESQLRKCVDMKIPKSGTTKLGEEIVRLYMHEVALHAGQNSYDFQPPFTEETLNAMLVTAGGKLTAGHIDSLSTCLVSTHIIFDTFLSFSVDTVRGLPTFHMVRLVYAAVVLIKMSIDSTVNESVIGKILKVEDFRIEEYLIKLATLLGSAAEGDKCQSAAKFKMVLVVLRTLFHKHTIKHTRQPIESSQSGTVNGGAFSDDRAVLQHPNADQNQNQEFMSSREASKRLSTSTANVPRNNSYDHSANTLANSSGQAPFQTPSTMAAAPVEEYRGGPDANMPDYPRADTVMADNFDYESMALNFDGSNFYSFFVNDDLMNSVLDSVSPEFFNSPSAWP